MSKIQHEVIINAPKQQIWEILADFGGVVKYNPNLRASHSTSEANGGIGATRHCDLYPMGSIEERIINWTEGDAYQVEIYDGQGIPPFSKAFASLHLQDLGTNRTRLLMRMDYDLKFGPLGALMDAAMVNSQFDKAVRRILLGTKHYAETGEKIAKDELKLALTS